MILFWSVSGFATEPEQLAARLTPLIEAHHGKVAVAIKQLDSGESFSHRADEPMPTASLIKFPIMVEAYRQAEAKQIDTTKTLTLKEADKVPGSGILTSHFSAGATFPLRDAIRLMIVYSDNTATNLVIDEIGLPATARYMDELGLPNTKLHAKVFRRDTSIFPERSKQFGLGSTTAAEMVRLLELLHQNKLGSAANCDEMLGHLLKCDDEKKLLRSLPPGTKVAHKSGSLDAVRCEAGLIYLPRGTVAICVLTAENQDHSWGKENAGELLCGEIAKAAYDYFNRP
jgi:beta-lactamase class A